MEMRLLQNTHNTQEIPQYIRVIALAPLFLTVIATDLAGLREICGAYAHGKFVAQQIECKKFSKIDYTCWAYAEHML
jgi:hypothetical protein